MSKFWSPIVSSLQPYVAGEQPRIDNLVKLNTNENPYGPSPKAIAAIEAEAGDRLRLYPDPASIRLRTAIANLHGVDIGEIFVGKRFGRSAGPHIPGAAETRSATLFS